MRLFCPASSWVAQCVHDGPGYFQFWTWVCRGSFYSFLPKSKLDRIANHQSFGDRMGRKATIVISLVDESCERSSEEIQKEIFRELSRGTARIPWCRKIEEVRVT